MKITGADSARDPNANIDVDARRDVEKDGTSAFSKLLSKKQQPNQDSQSGGEKTSQSDFKSTITSLLPNPETLQGPMDTAPIEAKHVVPVPPELHQLVREISVVVNAPGVQQVHIELNSNVLKGLHICIDRQDGAVAVRFQSSSDEIARLLSKNSDALADALVDRGVNLRDIRISGPENADNRQDYKNRFRDRGAWQGGGSKQGQGRR